MPRQNAIPPVPPPASVSDAVAELRRGRLVAIPTETVYGLAADAKNPAAVKRIFELKGRPAEHPLIVHIAGADRISDWALDIPDIAYRLAERFWPGPLTLILNKRPDVPEAVTGGQDTVGLRCPDNPLALALLREFDGGLAAPSANRFGRISPTTAQHVRDEFGADAPMVLDGGPCRVGIESTIVDLSRRPARLLRPGRIGLAALREWLPELQAGAHGASPRVSGSLAAHYAPLTPMRLYRRAEISAPPPAGIVLLALGSLPHGASGIALPAEPGAYAQGLYAALRDLDAEGADAIWLECLPDDAAWQAVNDRVGRALAGAGR